MCREEHGREGKRAGKGVRPGRKCRWACENDRPELQAFCLCTSVVVVVVDDYLCRGGERKEGRTLPLQYLLHVRPLANVLCPVSCDVSTLRTSQPLVFSPSSPPMVERDRKDSSCVGSDAFCVLQCRGA